MLEKEKKTFSEVVFLLLSSCGDNTAGGGFEAHSRKNYISIERMSCCAGVTAPQSRDLRPLTPAEVCVYWNIDPSVLFCLQGPAGFTTQDAEWRKKLFRVKNK